MYLIGCGMEEELSQVRSSRNLLEERMENELEQIRQELSDKEAIINEQRTTTEAQRRAFEEELNLRRDEIENNETALRDLRVCWKRSVSKRQTWKKGLGTCSLKWKKKGTDALQSEEN